MPEFDLDMDIEAELAGIRGPSEKKKVKRPEPKQVEPQPRSDKPTYDEGSSNSFSTNTSSSERRSETEGSSLSHAHGGESVTTPTEKTGVVKKEGDTSVDWKRFKTMHGIFEHVGGDRPVRLNPNIKKTQASGIPEPMLKAIQLLLKEKYVGNIVTFPWGDYTITENNRVFTAKSSLVRYLLFDAFRDEQGTHVQYAKQWMVLQHPVFDEGFNPDAHLGPTNDELDIYSLLFVSHASEDYGGISLESEKDYQTAERIGMLNMSIGRIMDKLNEQEQAFQAFAEREHTIQTILLLDRMGLLKGGLPKDVEGFVRILEQNRDAVAQTNGVVNHHIETEKKRQKTLAREKRMRQYQSRISR